MAGSLTRVGKELAKSKLDLVGVQKIGRDRDEGGYDPAGNFTFLNGTGHDNHDLGTGFFVHKGILSS
jgi:hypothetical protein